MKWLHEVTLAMLILLSFVMYNPAARDCSDIANQFSLYGCKQLAQSRSSQPIFVFTARCYASAVLAMVLCLFVRHKSRVFCRNGWTNRAGFWHVSFHPSYIVLKGNLVISKNNGTSFWNFVLNSRLRKFRHGISIVETCYQLSLRKVDAQSVINWTVVDQLSR